MAGKSSEKGTEPEGVIAEKTFSEVIVKNDGCHSSCFQQSKAGADNFRTAGKRAQRSGWHCSMNLVLNTN